MADKFLVVIGCNDTKLKKIDKKVARRILDFINSSAHMYTGVISVVRQDIAGSENFKRSGETLGNNLVTLDYSSDDVIVVPGYDVDCKMFRKDAQYDIVGVSTSASVLCCAMSMYSNGLRIRVLKDYCEDRKGKHLEQHAFEIMEAYMPGVCV